MNDIAATETAEQDAPRTVHLTPAEFAATKAKLAKVNARAAKRGFTGRFEITGERVEETKTNALGFQITEVFYLAQITGETPKYNGWTFLARVDVIGDTFTLATAPGIEHVDRDLVRPGHCDHCTSNRARKATYLVVNADGEVRNVGSTCIKDFLGWSGNFTFISEEQVGRDLFGMGFGGGEPTWTVETVIAAAYAVTRAYGWVPASFGGRTTASVVKLVIGAVKPSKNEMGELNELRGLADEALSKVPEITEFILSDAFAGTSTYADNLKAAVAAGEGGWKQIGLLASAPQALARHLETAADRAAREARWAAEKAAKSASGYIGKPGDKIEIKGHVSAIRWAHHKHGSTAVYTITTEDNNLVTWFSGNEALGDTKGIEVHLIGTVKKHEEWQDRKSTVVTHCAKVNPHTGRPFNNRLNSKHDSGEHADAPHEDCIACVEG